MTIFETIECLAHPSGDKNDTAGESMNIDGQIYILDPDVGTCVGWWTGHYRKYK